MGDNFAADIAELASGLDVGDSDSVSGGEPDDLYDHDYTMTEQELWEYEHPEGDAEEFAEHLRRRDGNVECQAHDLALPKKVIEGDKYGGLSLSKLAGAEKSYESRLKTAQFGWFSARETLSTTGAAIDADEVVRQFTFKQVVDVMRSQGENPQKALLISFMTALVEEIQNDKKSSDARAELLLIESAKCEFKDPGLSHSI